MLACSVSPSILPSCRFTSHSTSGHSGKLDFGTVGKNYVYDSLWSRCPCWLKKDECFILQMLSSPEKHVRRIKYLPFHTFHTKHFSPLKKIDFFNRVLFKVVCLRDYQLDRSHWVLIEKPALWRIYKTAGISQFVLFLRNVLTPELKCKSLICVFCQVVSLGDYRLDRKHRVFILHSEKFAEKQGCFVAHFFPREMSLVVTWHSFFYLRLFFNVTFLVSY